MKKINAEQIGKLKHLLKGAERIVITSHMHPDGDAVGSTIAMLSYLTEGLRKEAVVVLPENVPDHLLFAIPPTLQARVRSGVAAVQEALRGADLLIALDLNELSRTEELRVWLEDFKGPRVLIDHHVGPDTAAFDLVFSETQISSACELLYWLLTGIEGKVEALPAHCREALMTGMTTDTNNFANSVFPTTLEMASGLLASGVDRDQILENLYQKGRENRIRLMGYLLSEGLTITPEGAAFMILREQDKRRFGILEGETDGFVNLPLAVGKVRISLLLKEENGIFRVSIRAKKPTSARILAVTRFHGGGHEQAAGGKVLIPEDIPSPEAAPAYITRILEEYLR